MRIEHDYCFIFVYFIFFQRKSYSLCARSSVDRVLASEAKGRAFDSRRAHHLLREFALLVVITQMQCDSIIYNQSQKKAPH